MAFQFQCPSGHLLQGEESQAGQQCQCPMCQTLFIIPPPVAEAQPEAQPEPAPQNKPAFPQITPESPQSAAKPTAKPQEPEVLHIPCPECRKELETPVEMLDQDVMCPHCQAQFQLRRRDSIEFKRKRKQEREMRERKADRAWFNFAIVAVVVVLIFLGVLIFMSVAG